jgi:ATP-binding protein involved in chromosome partitioning
VIGQVVAVGSGKGGVGKSSVVVALGRALRARGQRVGILDADLYGPDIPLMLGVTRTVPAGHVTVWQAPGLGAPRSEPVELAGMRVMSLQFLVAEGQAFAAAGPMASLMIGRMCTGIDWGDLDYLLVDLPPGTGDVTQAVVQSLSIGAALVVVTPQDVAHLDTRKLLDFLAQREVRVLGGVENMCTVTCPCCDHEFPLFPAAPEQRTIWEDGVARLLRLPFDQARFGSRAIAAGDAPDGALADLAARLVADLRPGG